MTLAHAMCSGPCPGGHAPDWYCHAWNAKRQKWCHHRAGAGTDHKGYGNCKDHFGRSPNGQKHGAALRAQGEVGELYRACEVEVVGLSDFDAMQRSLLVCRVWIEVCQLILLGLDAASSATELVEEGPRGGTVRSIEVASAGLLGPDHQGDLTFHPAMDRLEKWIRLHALLLKTAHDMGIEERRQRLAEDTVNQLQSVLLGAAGRVGLDMAEAVVVAAVRAELAILEGGAR